MSGEEPEDFPPRCKACANYAFDIEKYLAHRLKLREDETYAVYEVNVDDEEMEEESYEQEE